MIAISRSVDLRPSKLSLTQPPATLIIVPGGATDNRSSKIRFSVLVTEIFFMKSYVVKVEGLVPVTVEYRVNAESEQEAFEKIKKMPKLPDMPPRVFSTNFLKIMSASARDVLSYAWVKLI